MDDFQDYYIILGTSRNATQDDIKKAYLDKCYILHPDRLQGAPESAKRIAEQELVKINKAYEVLGNTRKRQVYDIEWVAHQNKPKPVAEPSKIQFKNVRPEEIRTTSFIVRNIGGPYSNLYVSDPDTWVRLIKWHSLSASDELPLQVNIEVKGPNTGNKFNETIKIRLDNEELQLPVMMKMRKEPSILLDRVFKIFRKIKGNVENERKKKSTYQIPNWIKAFLLVFFFSVLGLGISYVVGIHIPFWILFGFSLIYSVEKWLYYFTRRYKGLFGKLYRLLLNILILALLILLLWSGIKLFSHQFVQNSLIGCLIFLSEFIFFVWIWRIVAKNSWRWPSMKLTIFSLVVLFLVFAFAGVEPMTNYKDTALSKLKSALYGFNISSTQESTVDITNNPIVTYDKFNQPNGYFSIDYPKGWHITANDAIPDNKSYELSGTIADNSSSNASMLIVLLDGTYEEWFNIFNSPRDIAKLEHQDMTINKVLYSTFIQTGLHPYEWTDRVRRVWLGWFSFC